MNNFRKHQQRTQIMLWTYIYTNSSHTSQKLTNEQFSKASTKNKGKFLARINNSQMNSLCAHQQLHEKLSHELAHTHKGFVHVPTTHTWTVFARHTRGSCTSQQSTHEQFSHAPTTHIWAVCAGLNKSHTNSFWTHQRCAHERFVYVPTTHTWTVFASTNKAHRKTFCMHQQLAKEKFSHARNNSHINSVLTHQQRTLENLSHAHEWTVLARTNNIHTSGLCTSQQRTHEEFSHAPTTRTQEAFASPNNAHRNVFRAHEQLMKQEFPHAPTTHTGKFLARTNKLITEQFSHAPTTHTRAVCAAVCARPNNSHKNSFPTCPGGELERTRPQVGGKRAGMPQQTHCRYCFNANSAKKVRKMTSQWTL